MTNPHARVAPGSLVLLSDSLDQDHPALAGHLVSKPARAMAQLKSGKTTVITAPPVPARFAVDYASAHGRPVVVLGAGAAAFSEQLDRPTRILALDAGELDQVVLLGDDLSGLNDPVVVFGDLHQCWRTYLRLRDWARAVHGPRTLLVSVGDLFDKGGSTHADVVSTARILREDYANGNLLVVMGNHDLVLSKRLTKAIAHGTPAAHRAPRALLAASISDATATMRWIQALPLFVRADPETIVVHAAWSPELAATATESRHLTDLCLYGPRPDPGLPRYDENGKHVWVDWAQTYTGTDMVIHGHDTRTSVRQVGRVVNVDTGCVDGNQLTGFVVGADPSDPNAFVVVDAHPDDLRHTEHRLEPLATPEYAAPLVAVPA